LREIEGGSEREGRKEGEEEIKREEAFLSLSLSLSPSPPSLSLPHTFSPSISPSHSLLLCVYLSIHVSSFLFFSWVQMRGYSALKLPMTFSHASCFLITLAGSCIFPG